MNIVEGIITLLLGSFVGFLLGCKFGSWFTRREMGGERYRDLKRQRDQLDALVTTAVELAEHQYVHHKCELAKSEAKTDDKFDDWIPG